jgi:uncharacterized protein
VIELKAISPGKEHHLVPATSLGLVPALMIALCLAASPGPALAAGAGQDRTWSPAFDCAEAEGMVEEMICADSILAALDVELDGVWRRVLELSEDNPDLDMIKAEQRGWVKGRNECWKSGDVRYCVWTLYKQRIAEFQALWRLVPGDGPYFFACEGNPANEVVATFYETDPRVAVLERGDQTVVAYLEPSQSGDKYEGRNVTFWMKGDVVFLVWGVDGDLLRCVLRAAPE